MQERMKENNGTNKYTKTIKINCNPKFKNTCTLILTWIMKSTTYRVGHDDINKSQVDDLNIPLPENNR